MSHKFDRKDMFFKPSTLTLLSVVVVSLSYFSSLFLFVTFLSLLIFAVVPDSLSLAPIQKHNYIKMSSSSTVHIYTYTHSYINDDDDHDDGDHHCHMSLWPSQCELQIGLLGG
ncbi:hypothetical protein Hanom_Chr17g01533571 [Helianthus anomalus]